MKALLRRWNAAWFSETPVLFLAITRIILVAGQLWVILFVNEPLNKFAALSQLTHIYWPLPVLRLLTLPFGWGWAPTSIAYFLVFYGTLAAGLLALIGLRTNISLAIFTAGSVFMQAYAYSFNEMHHRQAIMMIALVALTLSPCGKVLSLDDLLARLKRVIEEQRFRTFSLLEVKSDYARWPFRFLLWMFGLIYLSAAYFKFLEGGLDWMNGYTLQYYLLQDATRWEMPLGILVAQSHILCVLASIGSVLFESTFILAAIFPLLAWLYVPAALGLHAGIHATMFAPFYEYLILLSAFLVWLVAERAA